MTLEAIKIDLSQFVGKEVTVTHRDGHKESGILEKNGCGCYCYSLNFISYLRDGSYTPLHHQLDIVYIELAEESKVKASLTDASINAISKVIAEHLRDEVHDRVANKIRSEFNNEISESLVYKIAIEAIKKL